MPSDKPLPIPDVHVGAFSLLEGMDEDSFGKMSEALARVGFPTRHSEVVAAVSAETELSPDSAESLIDALLSLASAVGWLGQSAATVALGSDQITGDAQRQERLVGRVRVLLQCKALALLSKAVLLGGQHERLFASAQILTDVRPIFGADVEAEPDPEGAILVHTLRIHFVRGDGSHDSFLVAMADNDIEALTTVLRRATVKSDALQASLASFGLAQVVGD